MLTSYLNDVDVASPFVFFFAFFSDLDCFLPSEDVRVPTAEVIGSNSDGFGCGESSEEGFTFLAVERLGDTRSSPYPVCHHSQ